jgi:hypothetical protein
LTAWLVEAFSAEEVSAYGGGAGKVRRLIKRLAIGLAVVRGCSPGGRQELASEAM